MNSARNWGVLAVLAAVVCGCAAGGSGVTNKHVIPAAARPVIKDASEEELLERYNDYVRSLKSVNATVELKTTTGSKYNGVIDEYYRSKSVCAGGASGGDPHDWPGAGGRENNFRYGERRRKLPGVNPPT